MSSCDGEEDICCKTRIIRLALVKTVREWLTNKENLRYLHDSDECTCEYTTEELEYHNDFMTRLMISGKIQIDRSDEPEFDWEKEWTDSESQYTEPLDDSISGDQIGGLDSHSLNQPIDLAIPEPCT